MSSPEIRRVVSLFLVAVSIAAIASGCYVSSGRQMIPVEDSAPDLQADPLDGMLPDLQQDSIDSMVPDPYPTDLADEEDSASDDPPEETGPCCQLVGEPVQIDETLQINDEMDGGGPPSVAWNGRGWGVAWSMGLPPYCTFRALDAQAVPLGSPVRNHDLGPFCTSIGWNGNNYAMVGYDSYQRGFVAMLSESGDLVSGIGEFGEDIDGPDLEWLNSIAPLH